MNKTIPDFESGLVPARDAPPGRPQNISKKNDRGYYCDDCGKKMPVAEPIKNTRRRPGRNDPCPCGSGKKFKKCCLVKEKE